MKSRNIYGIWNALVVKFALLLASPQLILYQPQAVAQELEKLLKYFSSGKRPNHPVMCLLVLFIGRLINAPLSGDRVRQFRMGALSPRPILCWIRIQIRLRNRNAFRFRQGKMLRFLRFRFRFHNRFKVFFSEFCVIFTYFYYKIFEAAMQTEIKLSLTFLVILLGWFIDSNRYTLLFMGTKISLSQHVKHSFPVLDEIYHLLGNNPTLLDEPFHTIEKAR